MKRIRETIIVEGRYDANTIKQCVDAHVIETSGFGIFNNAEKRKLIEMLAQKRGIIVFTDSDGAGFVIRNHVKSAVKGGCVKHAYIPEIEGKERRKTAASKAGLLGVEGMTPEIIIDALRRAGATFEDEPERESAGITKQDMYEIGLSGGTDSASKREELAVLLGLPRLLSANAFLAAVNMIFNREEFLQTAQKLNK
ncbi:MAG: DUF4093 domain-containing protein [Oscillospiraceae bacterium]|nr:DUF4093 domain-containing protein [Oscillospiraceae bacterium]MBQ4544436.1 DUF4093 domain-containing protein [Oscillospiraceae bacterium]